MSCVEGTHQTSSSNRKRCPVCDSRKYHGNRQVGFKCYRCGFKTIPEKIRKAIQEANNDKVIIESSKPSNTIINSSLFQEIHDLHNNAYKFKIIRDNPQINLERVRGFKGRYFIVPNEMKIRKSKEWLVIYNNNRNKVPLKNLDKTDSTMLEGLKNIALEIANKYSFEIDPTPILFSKNRHEVKTGFLSANNFYEEEAKAVYPVPSPIELHGKNSVDNAINLSTALVKLNQSINLEIQNKQLHQNVLLDMRDALRAIQLNVSKPEGFADKILNILGLLLAKVKNKTASNQKLRSDENVAVSK